GSGELGAEARPTIRRVRANHATANLQRADSALMSGDMDAVRSVYAETVVVVDHPTRTTYDRDGLTGIFRSALRAERVSWSTEPIATLGDSLALSHWRSSFAGMPEHTIASWGEVAFDAYVCVQVDADGRAIRVEHFAGDRLGEAIVRLYELGAADLPIGHAVLNRSGSEFVAGGA